MNKEHKIVLSMYYAIEDSETSLVEGELTQKMDMIQLLLFMEGVFNKIEYKYLIEDSMIKIIPESTYENEYESLVDQTNELYRKAKILNVFLEKKIEFDKFDYEEVDNYLYRLNHIKNRLYFINILFNYVSCTSVLPDRQNLVHSFLFNFKNGKDFVSCLITMALKLLVSYENGGSQEANKVIEALNNCYALMESLYRDRDRILEDMQRRNRDYKNRYRNGFFLNEYFGFNLWINKHRNTKDFFDFIFPENNAFKSYAFHFMQHIIKISHILLNGNSITIQWEEKSEVFQTSKLPSFYRLDGMVDTLEYDYGKTTFNLSAWIGKYASELYNWVTVNNFY